MSPRLIALLVFIVWLVTVIYLMSVLGCSPSNPC